MIDHCVAFAEKHSKEKMLVMYTTDALKMIAQNTAKSVSGSYFKHRYEDIITPKKEENEVNRADASGIIEKMKNKVNAIRER